MTKEVYRSSMNQNKLMTAATVTCQPGVPTKIGEYIIKAGEMVSLGYGIHSGLHDATGRIFCDVRDNSTAPGAALSGTLRFQAYSPLDRPIQILAEFDTDIVNDNATDRTKQTPFPFNENYLSEDKKLVVEFISDAAAAVTVSKSNTKMLFDTTQAVV